jgi:CheY-like chemotaxis protein
LKLRWKERGGPRVKAPSRRGFGSRLIETTAKGDGGTAKSTFEVEGVTWEIDLPLSTEALATKGGRAVESNLSVYRGSSATVQSAPLADMRLLIVEDEPLVAMDCAEALEGAGATIAGTAGNLDDALRDIGRLEFDAAVLDANLYGRSVDPAAAALTRRGIPFIFVSGYNKEALPKAFLHAPTLCKPYTSDALVAAVQGVRQSPKCSN